MPGLEKVLRFQRMSENIWEIRKRTKYCLVKYKYRKQKIKVYKKENDL